MGKHLFKVGINGKLDIGVTSYNPNGDYLRHSCLTYDSKPTIREVVERNFILGVSRMVITSTPSYEKRVYSITFKNNKIYFK